MKKFFQSKGFIVSSLALLCITILGVCWFVSRDRTGDFRPDESPPSSVTGDWSDGGTQTDGDNGADAYAPGQSTDAEEEYPKVTSQTEDEVVIDFTDTEKPEDTPPPVPEGKTEIKDPGQEHAVNPDPSVPEVTAPPAEQTPPSNDPVPGSSNGNGAVYDPVFGWVVPGDVQQSTGDSDGDLNKQVGNIGMLCAITYVTMVVGRIPIILFLKYDPSDVIVTLGGFIWGPMTSCIVSVIVATLEMITVSDTGILGCIMNIVQTLSFACTASIIYKKKHTLSGALIGLASGWLITVIVMLLWNYLVTPLYMGYPREAVVELLLPAFLPFNLLKGGLNASITFLLYKPIVTALRKSGYISTLEKDTRQQHTGLLILANFIIVTCVLIILSMNGII